jgi:GT2 family glycosyltransferase
MVELDFPDVRLIRNQRNVGFAAANNIGIKRARGKYVALINSDVVILSGCFDRLLEYMELHVDVGIIGPKILWPDGTLQNSCRKFPSLWNNFCTITGLRLLFPKSGFFSGEHMRYFEHDRLCCVDYLVGCFLLVRRSAMVEVGLLDEQFFMYAEEVDWCKRFWDSKWRVIFSPGAQAIHVGRGSSSNQPARFALEQERAVIKYWAKHHSPIVVACVYSLKLVQQFLGIGGRFFLYAVDVKRRQERGREVLMHASSIRELLALGFHFCRRVLSRPTQSNAGS